MALEMNTDKVICPTCGTGYSKRKGFFPVSYGELYKGLGYIPYCRSCIDKIYSQYLAQCKDSKMAVRQTCRKLDLYWNESIFDKKVCPNDRLQRKAYDIPCKGFQYAIQSEETDSY